MALLPLSTDDQAGEIKVNSFQLTDLPGLKNSTNSTLRISFRASGQWCLYNVPSTDPELAIFNALTDWKGMVHLGPKHDKHEAKWKGGIPPGEEIYYKYKWNAIGQHAGSLIAEVKDPQGSPSYLVGSPSFINLPPGCAAEFYMNDDTRWYGDNSGQITLTYTCAPITTVPPEVKKVEGAYPKGVFPTDLTANTNMFLSYKGIDFYPLDFKDHAIDSRLIGIKEGKVVRAFNIRGFRVFTNITVEPQTQTVRFDYASKSMTVLARIPWGSLIDATPPQIISNRPLKTTPVTTGFIVRLTQ